MKLIMRRARLGILEIITACLLLGNAVMPIPAGAELPVDPVEIGISAPLTPPATYYGQVRPGPGFVPAIGMSVTAWIGDHLCGQSGIIESNGELWYTVNVVGEGPGGIVGCGAPERAIIFQIDTQFMAPTAWWDNDQIHDLPLEPMRPPIEPSVAIQRSADSLTLSWPQVTLDTNNNATLVTRYRIWRGTQPYFDPDQLPCNCVNVADVSGLGYTDSDMGLVDVVGDVSTNYAYVVRAINPVGASAVTRRVGEFDFALVPGSW
ncbi:MAG: hypothetical protein NT169_22795 [Chloroflexi bacterium]|nr:hypothetical protein [Chloroflexota bacterium]